MISPSYHRGLNIVPIHMIWIKMRYQEHGQGNLSIAVLNKITYQIQNTERR